MKEKIFKELPVVAMHFHQCSTKIHQWMECYNVTGEPDDDDPLNIKIHESEGVRVVERFGISSDQFLSPLKVKKVNIGSPENPKFTNIGDYWEEDTVGKVTDLLHEFQDLFPTRFLEMKGIVGYIGEMKISLNLDAKMVKQCPYRLDT